MAFTPAHKVLLRSTAAGLAGFVVYGGWAYFANMAHGEDIAMRSGLVQGGYSLVLTFVMTLVTEFLFLKLLNVLASAVIVSVILFSSAYTIHMLVGTPEILMTIFPGWVIGSIYTEFYLLGLERGTRTGSWTATRSKINDAAV